MDDYSQRVQPSVPGEVSCLKCSRVFLSPDRKSVRICSKCKRDQERFGLLAEQISGASGVDLQTTARPSYGDTTGFPVPPPLPVRQKLQELQARADKLPAAQERPRARGGVKAARPVKPAVLPALPVPIMSIHPDEDLFGLS